MTYVRQSIFKPIQTRYHAHHRNMRLTHLAFFSALCPSCNALFWRQPHNSLHRQTDVPAFF